MRSTFMALPCMQEVSLLFSNTLPWLCLTHRFYRIMRPGGIAILASIISE